jgi:hypothetical protein
MSGQLHAPAALPPSKGWVGSIAGLDVEKRKFLTLRGPELQPLGRPACNQSLYWLSYPGSSIYSIATDETRAVVSWK